jgi:signal transduction histidine kinase
MKWTYKTVLELIAILAMAAVVFVLGLLQYRWTGEISRTEQERLKNSLAASVRNFSQEFSYDFQRLCEGMEIDPEAPSSDFEGQLQRQFANWRRATSNPDLVASLYIWRTDNPRGPYLEIFGRESTAFQQIAWPAELGSLQQFLTAQSQKLSYVMPNRDAVYYPWTFYEEVPALVRPLFRIGATDVADSTEIRPVGFLVVRLDQDFLTREYLPELVAHNFGASDFEAAVRTAKAPYQALYVSIPDFPIATASPDAAVYLFDAVGEEARRRGHPSLQPSDDAREWQLVVQHPAGSLETAMADLRRRDLAISLGLLAILSGSTVLLFTAVRRAERLARLQMEFVAGVSHELCTPLAVINSAAENLVDGVVDDPRQMVQYGGMIRDQGRRLERLVDEVLLFAAGRFGRSGYELRPVEVGPIVTQSLLVSESMLRDSGFTVEKELALNLPPVVADSAAVSKCIENLVSNAMKYAGGNKWIGVRARVMSAGRQPEVQITVEDKGIGIAASDLPHIFEPFYRVRAVRDGQIRGVGLGLYLVKRMMDEMGGSVTVVSEPERGTFFTLHFPAAEALERQPGEAAEAAGNPATLGLNSRG